VDLTATDLSPFVKLLLNCVCELKVCIVVV